MNSFRFRVLLRHFLTRSVDPDIVASGGEAHQMVSNVLGLLLGGSCTIALGLAVRYGMAVPAQLWGTVIAGDQQFFALLSLLTGAVLAALGAGTLFPDRRDAFTLGPLPVPLRELFAARLAAVAVTPLAALTALNLFPGILLPALGAPFIRHWSFVLGAGLLPFVTLVALQSLLVLVCPAALRGKLQGLLQIVWTLGALAFFQLAPDMRVLPPLPVLLPPITAAAVLLFALAFPRALREAIAGQPGPPARDRVWLSSLRRTFDRIVLPDLRERAVFWFISRTMARSARHRMLMALYAAVGFAFVVEATSWVVVSSGRGAPLRAEPALLLAPLNAAFFVLAGLRALFVFPIHLEANWLFQVTERGPRAPYLNAARKFAMLIAIAPAALAPLPFFLRLLGPRVALEHAAFTALSALLILEYLLDPFPKIPFTCSYLPGKANVKVRFGVWLGCYIFFSWAISVILYGLIHRPQGFPWVLTVLACIWGWKFFRSRRRRSGTSLVFDDVLDSELNLLALQH